METKEYVMYNLGFKKGTGVFYSKCKRLIHHMNYFVFIQDLNQT